VKTTRTEALPLFPTQVIGSLPQPKAVLDLLAIRDGMDHDRYRATMDDGFLQSVRLMVRASG
jgi:methionine synthase II (cobalamin-independent)